MKILALENSSALGSIAFLNGESEPLISEFRNDNKHSGLFFKALESASDRLTNLDTIVVGLGPGSYAGVRIALSAAFGLQAACGATLSGLPSLCALAMEEREYAVIGDARRESFFFALVRAHEVVHSIDLCDERELISRLEQLPNELPIYASERLELFPRAKICYPSALMLAQLIAAGSTKFMQAPLEPVYLRAPYITKPKGTGVKG